MLRQQSKITRSAYPCCRLDGARACVCLPKDCASWTPRTERPVVNSLPVSGVLTQNQPDTFGMPVLQPTAFRFSRASMALLLCWVLFMWVGVQIYTARESAQIYHDGYVQTEKQLDVVTEEVDAALTTLRNIPGALAV